MWLSGSGTENTLYHPSKEARHQISLHNNQSSVEVPVMVHVQWE